MLIISVTLVIYSSALGLIKFLPWKRLQGNSIQKHVHQKQTHPCSYNQLLYNIWKIFKCTGNYREHVKSHKFGLIFLWSMNIWRLGKTCEQCCSECVTVSMLRYWISVKSVSWILAFFFSQHLKHYHKIKNYGCQC